MLYEDKVKTTMDLYHLFHQSKKFNEEGALVSFDGKLRNKLVEENLLLVRYVANRWYGKNRNKEWMDDIIQEGQLGLFRAVVKFDPNYGCQFSTYAVPWIRQFISGYFKRQKKSVKASYAEQEELDAYADESSTCEDVDCTARATETLDLSQLSDTIAKRFNQLPQRTKYVIMLRFGIINESQIEPKTSVSKKKVKTTK